MQIFNIARPIGVEVSNFSVEETNSTPILLKQIHHDWKIQNRTADPVQLIHDHLLHFPSADICQKLLKLWPDCILAAVALILVPLKLPPFNSYLQNSI